MPLLVSHGFSLASLPGVGSIVMSTSVSVSGSQPCPTRSNAEPRACASSVALRAFINSHSFPSKLGILHLAKTLSCCAGTPELKQSVGNPDVPANNELQKVRPAVCHSIQCFRIAPSACSDNSFTCLHGTHSAEFPFHILEA